MKRMTRLPRTAMLLLAWLYFSSPAHAQNATWNGTTSSDWNTPSNWNQNVVPTEIATFNPSTPTSITFSQGSTAAPTTIQTLLFNASGFTFGLTPIPSESSVAVAITGVGIQPAASAPTFNVDRPVLEFENSSTAGHAILNAFNTGPIAFLNTSTAGNATINAGLAGQNSSTDPKDSRAVSYSSRAAARLLMRKSQVFGLRTSNLMIRARQVMRQSPPRRMAGPFFSRT
jgi:hypothetical protein